MGDTNEINDNNLIISGGVPVEDKKSSPSFSRKKLPLLLISLFAVILIIGAIYLIFSKLNPEVTNRNTSVIPTPIQNKKPIESPRYRVEDIIGSSEKISVSQYAPDNNSVFLLAPKDALVANVFKENEKGPMILVMDNLIYVNLVNGEKKEFDLYALASEEILNPLKAIPEQIQLTLFPNLLKWSSDNQNFWGAISLASSAAPPANDSMSFFKINTSTFQVEKFALPGSYINTLKPQSLNLEKEAVLLETATSKNELYLYLYEIPTKKQTTIVSYPNSIFSKYLPGKYGFLGYFYPSFLGDDVESRQLESKWVDNNTISYIDFVTRKEVIKKIVNNTEKAITLLESIPEIQIIKKSVIAAGRKPFFTPESENGDIVQVSLRESFPDDPHTSRIDTFNINIQSKIITVYDVATDKDISLDEWKKTVKERFQ